MGYFIYLVLGHKSFPWVSVKRLETEPLFALTVYKKALSDKTSGKKTP